MMAVANAVETLRVANYVERREVYRWTVYSLDGNPAIPSSGVSIKPTYLLNVSEDLPDVLIVCGGVNTRDVGGTSLRDALLNIARRGMALGGISSGIYPLMAAGLMDGYRCAIHWEDVASLAAEFPRVRTSDEIFIVDRDRMTCAGGAAAVDMMLSLISIRLGSLFARQVSRYLVLDRIRSPRERQARPVSARLGFVRHELIEAVELMEANVAEPLSSLELARLVGLSERHMGRIFRAQLDSTPAEYYMTIRLNRARGFLLKSDDEIGAVALKCGFTSAGTFSKAYRRGFGHTPSAERQVI